MEKGNKMMKLLAPLIMMGGLSGMPYSLNKILNPEILICKTCGEEFSPASSNKRIYCSAECFKNREPNQ